MDLDRRRDLTAWTGLRYDPPDRLRGRWADLERVDPDRHGAALHRANEADDGIWHWLPYGPFETRATYAEWLEAVAASPDPAFYAIRADEAGADWAGVAALMRIDRDNGAIEIGHICLSPALQRTRVATEAIYLLADQAFAAGFRRLEWKCNAANEPSRRAAARFGFAYEGTFRQAAVVKGRNRDTAWFSIVDDEWPALRDAFGAWLEDANFDAAGRQATALSDLTRAAADGVDRWMPSRPGAGT